MSDWVDVATTEELPPGARRVVDVDGVQILVVNLDGEFFALEDVCTHDGTPIDEGDIHGDEITCPRHGARFCLRTGEALCAPAYEPIPTFPVRIRAGILQVRDPRFD
ncbi:MAG: non-heme iron oxygenase ferredoxin subunit [Gammaproteobacteria bacterium]|nr:non-heme iron oxygenase ferredoxin subunit [Gammaproteobacteria bacterium]MCG3142826.1 Naphthalene 1,2-dioxygenase/salicylate 5-hydroxylase system, ferredoxin component [Gammaproteobacteria bacterium]